MGNRVKGRIKKKSIKAASHSGWNLERKVSRMGKKQKKGHSGVDATFIGRTRCLKKLGLSLKDFRRLCILKGIYPREPRGRFPGNKKGQVYYHLKDVKAIAHEPLLEKFHEFKAYMKKVRKAAGRDERDEARRLDAHAPQYTLHHLVRERYPRFFDAMNDLDDALALVHLFAALPSERRIKAGVTKKAREMVAAWGAYVAATSSVTKSFVSVKGVYLEANVSGCDVRWIVPHSFTQNLPTDVDYRVMLTFFEFYDTLLGFVLFKLYNDMGIRYPLVSDSTDAKIKDEGRSPTDVLKMLRRRAADTGGIGDVVSQAAAGETAADVDLPDKKTKKKANKLLKTLGTALHAIDDSASDDGASEDEEDAAPVGAPLRAALDSLHEEDEKAHLPAFSLDEDAATRRKLFDGLTFFFSREVPRGYLEVVAVAFGAKVGWEGVGSPLSPCDPSVTHHVVDRPAMPASFEEYPASREYVQPQWLLDCANFRLLLPCARYGVGSDLPPHLSPWVNNGEVGYVPEYAEEIERLRKGGAPKPETPEVPEEVPQKEPEDNDEEVHARELAEEVGDAEEAEEVRKRARKRKVEESGEQPQVRTLNLSISAPVRVKIFIFRRSLPPIRTKTRSWPRS